MKITDLNGQLAKISKTSITVKDENGKTIGVITHCCELSLKESSEIWCNVKKAVGINAAKCIAKMRKVGDDIVYMQNVNSPDENAEKLKIIGMTIAKYRRLA